MFFDLKKNKGNKFIDMYDNTDYNDCKSKYNALIYILCSFYDHHFKSFRYTNEDIFETVKYNKEALTLYLYIIKSILNDQQIDPYLLNASDLSFINVLKGTMDITTFDGKRIVLNQIRNAFAHKNGKVFIYEEDGVKRVRIDNKNWFSIDCELDELNNLFKRVIPTSLNNQNQEMIDDIIYRFNYGDDVALNDKESLLLLTTLLMCYNKESVFDEYMSTQTAILDCSSFRITHNGLKLDKNFVLRNFFDRYNLSFDVPSDKKKFDEEWGRIVKDNLVDESKKTYVYSNACMAFDYSESKHIPNPIFLTYLRNACSHGFIEFTGCDVVFKDINFKDNPNIPFNMRIREEELLRFLHSDFFFESVLTSIENHIDTNEDEFYLVEKKEIQKSFFNFMTSYRNKYTNLTEEELIFYMYKNNKFSTYLLSNPHEIDNFKSYRLYDGTYLFEYLETISKDVFNEEVPERSHKDYNKIIKEYIIQSYDTLYNYLEDLFLYPNEVFNEDNKSNTFFIDYYLYMQNLNTTKRNTNLFDKTDLDKVKKCRKAFLNTCVSLNFNTVAILHLFLIVAIQKSKLTEIERIRLFYALDEFEYGFDIKHDSYSIEDTFKSRCINYLFLGDPAKNFKPYAKDFFDLKRSEFIKKIAFNLGFQIVAPHIEELGLFDKKKESKIYKSINECDLLTMFIVHELSLPIYLFRNFHEIEEDDTKKRELS